MLQSLVPAPSTQLDLRQLLENLYQGRTLQPYRAGQVIPLRPDELWIVCRGVVQLSTLYATGDEALLGLAGPSMPFGLPLTCIQPYQATALSDVDVMRLTWLEVQQSPQLAQGISTHLGRRLRQAEALLSLMGHRRIRDRLWGLLLLLSQEMGQPVAQGTRLNVRLTHQHLANAIGTTRVTVTRLLGQFKAEGGLLVDRQHHLILPKR